MPKSHTRRSCHRRRLRSQPESGARSPELAVHSPEPSTPQEASACAQQIIVRKWPGIIEALVKKALRGSYQHAKFLGDQAGLSAALASTAGADDESLAALLLKHLEIAPEEDSVSPGTTPLP